MRRRHRRRHIFGTSGWVPRPRAWLNRTSLLFRNDPTPSRVDRVILNVIYGAAFGGIVTLVILFLISLF